MKTQINFLLFNLFILSFPLIVAGCDIASNSPSDFPDTLMLSIDDVPTEWSRLGDKFSEVSGDLISHTSAFSLDTAPPYWRKISQTITIYPDASAAIKAYGKLAQHYFTQAWIPVAETNFKPLNSEDIVRLEFWDVQIEGKPVRSYRFLQQHENLIIDILTNIDNEYLTFAEFEEILGKLDTKLQDYQPDP